MVTRGTSQNERNKTNMILATYNVIFLNECERYAFEELTACFDSGDFKMPQTWTRAHRQCANPEGGGGGGGGGGREPGTPWKTTSSIGFYRKMQFDAITLKKVGPPEICDPLSGLFKIYSFFEITLVPNCKIC